MAGDGWACSGAEGREELATPEGGPVPTRRGIKEQCYRVSLQTHALVDREHRDLLDATKIAVIGEKDLGARVESGRELDRVEWHRRRGAPPVQLLLASDGVSLATASRPKGRPEKWSRIPTGSSTRAAAAAT